MQHKQRWFRIATLALAIGLLNLGQVLLPEVVTAQQEASDLYIQDTPFDSGIEPNPDNGPMWVAEDIWVRTTADPNYQPYPFPEASPSWTPLPNENPEYRDPKYSEPNYVYVRVRNRGSVASTGGERLRLYWTKAATGLAWPTQWNDYLPGGPGSTFSGAEVTKPRVNAATATQTERDAYVQAILDIGTQPAFVFPGGTSYWNKQDQVHQFGPSNRHGSLAFFPWHREFINRYEALLQEANPTVKLLYWNWNTNPDNRTGGFNFFSNTFMGAARGSGGIGTPFLPSLLPTFPNSFPANIVRNVGSTPPAISDASLLSNAMFQDFWSNGEVNAHNVSHTFIGGNMGVVASAAEDPFFFLLHANADRLWAQWQRNSSNLWRLDKLYAYGCDPNIMPTPTGCTPNNINVTTNMAPWNGSSSIRPWTTADGYSVNKTAQDASIVSPPIYDTIPLTIPALQPGEAVILQIPWYPPNPANFASFGADQGHFCLLARIETATSAPYGMTFAESNDIYMNTKNNNNIAWKNVTVVDNFPGAQRLTSILVRNVFEEKIVTGLHFANTDQIGGSFFDFGSITVDLGKDLFERWREGGGKGRGIEPIGGTTAIRIESPDAFIQGITLAPDETFSVGIQFELSKDYRPVFGLMPQWDMIQLGTPQNPEAVVGGQRFQIDVSKLVLVPAGSSWRYLDAGATPDDAWLSTDFNDGDWPLGQTSLGFGNNPVTTIDGGAPDDRHITTYARTTFDVTDPNFFQSFYLRLKRDDGAVVYLNGKEIYRDNLPEGEITSKTLATRDVDGLERDIFFPVKLDPGLLVEGKNVLAVEIHLASSNSQDLGFDLELYANPGDTRFAPSVAFTPSTDGGMFRAGDTVPLEAEALDPDGKIASVSFLVDGQFLGSVDSAPYILKWDGASPGSHRIEAIALDDDQRESVTDSGIIVVDNLPPSVELTQPTDGSMFQAGEAVPVSAQASDDGKISRVEFYVQRMELFSDPSILAGTAESAPYEISLTDLEPGEYMVTAVAVDDKGATNSSLPSMIMIHQ